MAKLKLWVRNLIISLVLIVSLSGVGVGLYFLLKPKPEQVAPRELTPAQKEFVNTVSQAEQKDVEHTLYDGIVLSDGSTTSTIGLADILGQKDNYVVITNSNQGNRVEIYEFAQANGNNLVLNRVATTAEFDSVITNADGSLAIGGHFAKVQKDGNEFIINLNTGATVMQKANYEGYHEEAGYVGTYNRSNLYFDNNILIVSEQVVTEYTSMEDFTIEESTKVYHLDNTEKPLVFNKTNGLLISYEIDAEHVVLVSTKNTSVYSTTLVENNWAQIFDPISNVAVETTGDDAVVEVNLSSFYTLTIKYKKIEYTTITFVPNSNYVVLSRNVATTTDRVAETNENREVYDVVHRDTFLNADVLLGTNNRLWNFAENKYQDNIKFEGLVETKKSNLGGYYQFVVKRVSQSSYNPDVASLYATYYDTDFNHIVTYDYKASGDIIGIVGDIFVSGNGETSYFIDKFGDIQHTIAGYTFTSTNMYNSMVMLKRSGSDAFYLKDLATGTLYGEEENYTFMTEITNGKVVAYADGDGFYEINLDTMASKPLYHFDVASIDDYAGINLVAASGGYYFDYDADAHLYTLHRTDGTKYQNIKSYSFRQIDEFVYLEIVYNDDSTQLLRTRAMGNIGTYSAEEIAEKFVVTMEEPEESNSGASVVVQEISSTNPNKLMSAYVDSGSINQTASFNSSVDGKIHPDTTGQTGGSWGTLGKGTSLLSSTLSNRTGALESVSVSASTSGSYPTYTLSFNYYKVVNYMTNNSSVSGRGDYYSPNYGLRIAVISTSAAAELINKGEINSNVINDINANTYEGKQMNGYLLLYCPYAFVLLQYGSTGNYSYGRWMWMGFRRNCFVYDMSGWANMISDYPNPCPALYAYSGDECIPTNDLFTYGDYRSNSAEKNYVVGCLKMTSASQEVKFSVSPYQKEIKRYYPGIYNGGGYNGHTANFGWTDKDVDLFPQDSMLWAGITEVGTSGKDTESGFSNKFEVYLRDTNIESCKTDDGENNSTPRNVYKMTYYWVNARATCNGTATLTVNMYSDDDTIHWDEWAQINAGTQGYDSSYGFVLSNACTGDWFIVGRVWGRYSRLYNLKVILENTTSPKTLDIYTPKTQIENGDSGNSSDLYYKTSRGKVFVANQGPNGFIKYGFTTQNSYSGYFTRSYVGEPRTDLSIFTMSENASYPSHTFGYWLDGYSIGNNSTVRIDKNTGKWKDIGRSSILSTIASNTYLAPIQSPHQYNVVYHYITDGYKGDKILPLEAQTSDIVSAYNGFTANTEHITTSETRKFHDSQMSKWQIRANGATGTDLELPRGYDFVEWYAPGITTNSSYATNNAKLSRAATVDRDNKFGYWYSDSYNKQFDAPGRTITNSRINNEGAYTINVYAVYTPRTYNVQVNLTDRAGAANTDKLYYFDNSGSKKTEEDYIYDVGSVKLGDTAKVIDSLFLTKGGDKYYFDITLKATNHDGVATRSDKAISTGNEDVRTFGGQLDTDTSSPSLLRYSYFSAYSVTSGDNSFTTGVDGNKTILLNAVLTPMQYSVDYNSSIDNADNHVYLDNANAINTTLQTVGLTVFGDARGDDSDIKKSRTWESSGTYSAVYTNFFPGYQLNLFFDYYDGQRHEIEVTYRSYDDDDELKGRYQNNDVVISFVRGNVDNDGNFVNSNSGTALKVEFSNLGFVEFAYNSISKFAYLKDYNGTNNSELSRIYITAIVTSQPYDVTLKVGNDTSAQTSEMTSNGLPNKNYTMAASNSVSEYLQIVENAHRQDGGEQLGFGSTVLITTDSAMYKILHTMYYVPNQYISGFNIYYGDETNPIITTDGHTYTVGAETGLTFGEYMTKLFIAMGSATEADDTLGVRAYDGNDKLYLRGGAEFAVGADQINAVLRLLYGADNKIGYSYVNVDNWIAARKTLLYTIIPIENETTHKMAYLIVAKYDDGANENKEHFGIKTGIVFDTDGLWTNTAHAYSVEIDTTEYQSTIGWKIEHDSSVSGDHASITLNKNASYVGYYASEIIDPGIEQKTFVNDVKYRATNPYAVFDGTYTGYGVAASGASANDIMVAPADYFTFNLAADKGYYFDNFVILFNGDRYALNFVGFTMAGDAYLKPVYELSKWNGSTWTDQVTYVFGEDDEYVEIKVENLLLNFVINRFDANSGSTIVLHVGFIHNTPTEQIGQCTIDVSYAAYTFMRVDANSETKLNDQGVSQNIPGSNLIYWERSGDVISISKHYDDNGNTYNPTIGTITLPSAVEMFTYGTAGDKSGEGASNKTGQLYFFFKNFAIVSLSDKIMLESILANNISYELIKKVQAAGVYDYSANTSEWTQPDVNTSRTEQNVTSTLENGAHSNHVISLTIAPVSIKNIIKTGVDFDGKVGTDSYNYLNANHREETTENDIENNLNSVPGGLYYLNNTPNLENHEYEGQIVSKGTQISFSDTNQGSAADYAYYEYGVEYTFYGQQLVFKIHTEYGYEFAGVNFEVRFGENSPKYYVRMSRATLEEASSGNITLRVYQEGEETTDRVVGTYQFTQQGDIYLFAITVTNFNSTEFSIKVNYLAKTFDVEYATNEGFGSSAVVGAAPRKFIYNVKSSINTGTAGASGSHTAVAYTRDGYNQVGWAFSTAYFTKDSLGKTTHVLLNDGDHDSMTINSFNHANDTIEGATLSDYQNKLYRVGLSNDVAYDDAGYIWYLSLGASFGNVFGTTYGNNISKDAGKITMYAIWNAKTYDVTLHYNDSTAEKGSSTATKFITRWVFDAPIKVNDATAGELTFDAQYAVLNMEVSAGVFSSEIGNRLINTYRLGYTLDGWYFVDGGEWLDTNRIFDNTQRTKLALASDTLVDTTDVSTPEAINLYRLNETTKTRFGSNAWKEGSGEYTETAGVANLTYSAAVDTIHLYAKWTANTYSFIFDTNSANSEAENLNYANGSITSVMNSGVGSSNATLARTDTASEEFTVTFDGTMPATFNSYAYRYGYRFTGWYATRVGGDSNLIEGRTFNVTLLMQLQNFYTSNNTYIDTGVDSELNLIKAKRGVNNPGEALDYSNLVETQAAAAATITTVYQPSYAERVKDRTFSYGNAILLHARWEVLDYKIYIDLNNSKHRDYEWGDADYMVENDESGSSVNGNVIYDLKLYYVVTFDEKFENGRLYLNGNEVTGQLTYTRYGTQYTTTGTNAYEKMCQILYAYGYDLGLERDKENILGYSYQFTEFAGDGNGFVNTEISENTRQVNGDVVFNISYLEDARLAQNGDQFVRLNAGSVHEYIQLLSTIDKSSDGSGTHVEDMHSETATHADFGRREFTLFALWTAKDFYVENDIENSTKEIYSNNVTNFADQEIDLDTTKQVVKPVYNTNKNHLTEPLSTTINYLAPIGQYAESITIDFYNDREVLVAALVLHFGWDSVNHKTYIIDATVRYPNYIKDTTPREIKIISNNDLTTYQNEYADVAWLQYISQKINVSTSEYLTRVDSESVENPVNSYGNNWDESVDVNSTNYTFEKINYSNYARNSLNNYDINVIKFVFTDLKSNIRISAVNKAQTYQVDYYRLIRPTEGYETYYGEDQEDEATFGKELWDSAFLNDWNQYEVYRTETYRYGEYTSTTYGYASNFGFDNWYYYQGHMANENYNEYESYSDPSKVYMTNISELIPQEEYQHLFDMLGHWEARTYTWVGTDDEGCYKYVDEQGNEYILAYDAAFHTATHLESLTIHIYTYDTIEVYGNDVSTKDYYRFGRKPVAGNTSLIALYVPAGKHRIMYYVWNGTDYVERVDSSNEYVLGTKRVATITNATGDASLDRTYNRIEYWELGTNTDYYYVGFSGFNRFVEGTSEPTEMAVLTFLLQFINKDNYSSYAEHFDADANKLTIDWADLSTIIHSGIVFNGKRYSADSQYTTPVEMAKDLLTQLVDNYSSRNAAGETHRTPRIYGTNGTYLSDKSVVENLSCYVNIKSIIDALPVPVDTGKETIEYLGQNMAYNAAVVLYNNLVYNIVYQYYVENRQQSEDILDVIFNVTDDQIVGIKSTYTMQYPDDENEVHNVVYHMNAKDLNVLLDSIATDYFGFVYKNPTDVISDWPDDSYFAGWYKIDATLQNDLIGGSLKGKVLTFNSDTWGDDTCIAIVGESVDELGNVTYQLAGGYDVTRFNTINQVTGEIDILSRVDNEIFVFAAFNKYKFEFESGVETEDNPNKLDGVLYGMDKNSIQWAKKEVRDIDGNPYQYKIGDVKFAVLDEGTYSQLKEYVAEHHATIPTALETVMKANSSVKICSSLEDFMNSTEVDRTKNLYVIAFVYDIKSIQEIVNQDGTIRIEYNFDDSQTPATFKINIVSSNTLYFDATAEKINAWLETATNTKHNF